MNNLRSLFFVFLLIPSFFINAEEQKEAIELIYQKLNTLEKEIENLRSLIEENNYLIDRYQELQKKRYLDLDQRLHDVLSKELGTLDKTSSSDKILDGSEVVSEEISLYKKALELFDSARYAEALEVLREQIISFPEGKYSADAYFWSGELFLAQQQLEDARENYLVIIEKFSEHERVSDALYKLGLIARNMGQENNAATYFLKVVEEFPETGAAQLAKKSIEISQQESD